MVIRAKTITSLEAERNQPWHLPASLEPRIPPPPPSEEGPGAGDQIFVGFASLQGAARGFPLV